LQWKVSRPIGKESKKKTNNQSQFEKQAAPFSKSLFLGFQINIPRTSFARGGFAPLEMGIGWLQKLHKFL
jgi:hypothetical protein